MELWEINPINLVAITLFECMGLFTRFFIIVVLLIQLISVFSHADDSIEIQKPSAQAVFEDSPSQLTKNNGRWSQFYNERLTGTKTAALNMSSTAASFYIISLMRVFYRMATEPEQDVEMLRNFFTNQVFSTQAQVSMLVAITGIQSANWTFSKVAQKFNWLKDEAKIKNVMNTIGAQRNLPLSAEVLMDSKGVSPKLIKEWKRVRELAEKAVPGRMSQSVFQRLSLISSFAIVLPTISVLSDLVTDPDLIYYADSLVSSPEQIDKMIQEKGYSPYFAHQRAYQRWVKSHKILDYTPMILSAWTAMSVQAFVLPKVVKTAGKAGEFLSRKSPSQVSRALLKGINFTRSAGRWIPQGRIATIVGQGLVFLSIQTPILKIYENIYNEHFYSRQITTKWNSLKTASLRPSIPSECLRNIRSLPNFDQSKFDSLPYTVIRQTLMSSDSIDKCQDMELSMTERLDELSSEFSHWRQLWFDKSLEGLTSWQKRVDKIQIDYQYGYSLFKKFVYDASTKRDSAFEEYPFYGLGSVDSVRNTNNQDTELVKIYITLQKQIDRLSNKEKASSLDTHERTVNRVYREMFRYVSALNQTKYKPEELQKQYAANEKYSDAQVRNELALQRYVAHGFVLYKNQSADILKSFKNSPIPEVAALHATLEEVNPKLLGEVWFEEFVRSVSVFKIVDSESGYSRQIAYKNEVERLFIELACSGKTSVDVKRIPFWSLNVNFPSPLSTSAPCGAIHAEDLYGGGTEKTIFSGRITTPDSQYSNLVEWSVSNIRPEFKTKKENDLVQRIDAFWKTNVDSPLKLQLDVEEKEFFQFFNQTLYPSLVNVGMAQGLVKGVIPSIKQEVQIYVDALTKLDARYASVSPMIWSLMAASELIAKNPMAIDKWSREIKSNYAHVFDLSLFDDPQYLKLPSTIDKASSFMSFITMQVSKKSYDLLSEDIMNTEQGLVAKSLIDRIQGRSKELANVLKLYQVFVLKESL